MEGRNFILVFCCSFGVIASTDSVVVDSPFGRIRGVRKTDENTGLPYLSFKGIPYAKPPVGDLRFAKPQPHPKLEGTLDATKDDKIICPHSDKLTYGETNFTEDCLILNVYVKDLDLDETRSMKKVLVFIHGGGFKSGYSTFHDPTSFVIRQDVIVVTINYRFGILGFLSTENEASQGNYGLWDQNLAIEWVKDNIRAFGGDPDDLAVAGESAGGMSVGFHVISPYNKGLFTKAYAQSGAATSICLSENAQKNALSVAKSTGCWGKSVDDDIGIQESNTVMKCLRKVPLSALTAFSGFSLIEVQFTPRVDGEFIPDTPSKVLQDDAYLESVGFFDRTYMVGMNNNEAQASDAYLQVIKTVVSMDPGISDDDERKTAVQSYLRRAEDEYKEIRLGKTAASNKNISDEIDRFYRRRFDDGRSFIEMTTDMSYLLPPLDLLRAASRRQSCHSYFLHFDYFPQYMKGSYTGAPHGVDLLYWFDMEMSSLENLIHAGMQGQMDAEDVQLKSMFSSLIGEFIRSGNPGLALNGIVPCGWSKYDVINSQYLNFNPNPWIGRLLEKEKQDLWFGTVPGLMGAPAAAGMEDMNAGCGTNGASVLSALCFNNILFSTLFASLNLISSFHF